MGQRLGVLLFLKKWMGYLEVKGGVLNELH